MDGQRFDALARVLAQTYSRRRVVGLLGGALAGVLGWRGVGAQQNDCVRFCKAVFPPGEARGRCVAQAARGSGPCIECGADADSVCVTADGTVTCEFAACGTGRVCLAGECAGTGTCAPGSTVTGCSATCSDGFNACRETTEGVTVCVVGINCDSATPCTASTQCQPGAVCASGGVCGGTVCRAVCGGPAVSSAVARSDAASGVDGIEGPSDPPRPK